VLSFNADWTASVAMDEPGASDDRSLWGTPAVAEAAASEAKAPPERPSARSALPANVFGASSGELEESLHAQPGAPFEAAPAPFQAAPESTALDSAWGNFAEQPPFAAPVAVPPAPASSASNVESSPAAPPLLDEHAWAFDEVPARADSTGGAAGTRDSRLELPADLFSDPEPAKDAPVAGNTVDGVLSRAVSERAAAAEAPWLWRLLVAADGRVQLTRGVSHESVRLHLLRAAAALLGQVAAAAAQAHAWGVSADDMLAAFGHNYACCALQLRRLTRHLSAATCGAAVASALAAAEAPALGVLLDGLSAAEARREAAESREDWCEGRCALTLLPLDAWDVVSGLQGRPCIACAANLWLNAVQPTLPAV